MQYPQVVLTLAIIIISVILCCIVISRRMRYGGIVYVFVFILGASICLPIIVRNKMWEPIGRPIVVYSAKIGNLDTAIVQIHGGFGIYDTSFFVRLADKWEWYYLDHDGGRWNRTTVQKGGTGGVIEVSNDGIVVGVFQIETRHFRNLRNRHWYNEPNGYVVGDIVKDWDKRRYIISDGSATNLNSLSDK